MDDSFTLKFELPAPPAKVWRYLTDPGALATWYWPRRLQATYELDPELGGYYRFASQTAGMAVHGYFLEFQPPHSYTATWTWEGSNDETQVEVNLHEQQPGITQLTLIHSGHQDQGQLNDHETGWTDCLARLQERLQRVDHAGVRDEQGILDLIGRSLEQGRLLLHEAELSPEFFELGTGLLGELFQKASNYRLRLAIVLPQPSDHGPRMAELAHEHASHPSIRFFGSEAAASAWLATV